jgi:glyoxylase-like metal-dependent hydrolase (beta-lactamase superfamily II)
MGVIIERSMSSPWLSNTYLVADDHGTDAVLIDAGGPVEPLLAILDEQRHRLTHVLLTHHHHDHVAELDAVLAAHPHAEVLAHPLERASIPQTTGDLHPGDVLKVGELSIRALATPGHTGGMLSLLVNDSDVFTGDTLFKGSVGGVRAPGATGYDDLKHSVMDVLLTLAPATTIHPGHTEETTVADELETNPFVRIWRGVDPEGSGSCTVAGRLAEPRTATLVLLARDYDGGNKAWVRWPDGADDIVPGSWIEPADAADGPV